MVPWIWLKAKRVAWMEAEEGLFVVMGAEAVVKLRRGRRGRMRESMIVVVGVVVAIKDGRDVMFQRMCINPKSRSSITEYPEAKNHFLEKKWQAWHTLTYLVVGCSPAKSV
jgi:hypothetical protein